MDDGIPLGAVVTDTDSTDQTPILIGRAFVERDWHVGPVFCRNNEIFMMYCAGYEENDGGPIQQLVINEFHILVANYVTKCKLHGPMVQTK